MKKFILFSVIALSLYGCETIPKDAFKLSESSLEIRQLQTRFYEAEDEIALISSGIGVLQDMGYSIDETEKDAGLVTASKNVDATNAGQVAAAIFVALVGGGSMAIDKEQKIKVSFVSKPSDSRDGYLARATFQRIVWNSQGQISVAETLKTPELYTEFFDKLSKSVFFEAQSI